MAFAMQQEKHEDAILIYKESQKTYNRLTGKSAEAIWKQIENRLNECKKTIEANCMQNTDYFKYLLLIDADADLLGIYLSKINFAESFACEQPLIDEDTAYFYAIDFVRTGRRAFKPKIFSCISRVKQIVIDIEKINAFLPDKQKKETTLERLHLLAVDAFKREASFFDWQASFRMLVFYFIRQSTAMLLSVKETLDFPLAARKEIIDFILQQILKSIEISIISCFYF